MGCRIMKGVTEQCTARLHLTGGTADTSDKDKKRYRWLNRKPKWRHSVECETLDEQDKRPYKYVLKRERDLLPRP